MEKVFDIIMEVLYWILIFLSPFLILGITAVIVYLNNTANTWLPISLIATGTVLGILFAERIRRKYGTATYMGRIMGDAEFTEEDEKDKKKGS